MCTEGIQEREGAEKGEEEMRARIEGTSFELTPIEEKVLLLLRSGKSRKDIYKELGWSCGSKSSSAGSAICTIAAEKDRLRILSKQDKTRPSISITPKQAKNRSDRPIEPRRGRWKTGGNL